MRPGRKTGQIDGIGRKGNVAHVLPVCEYLDQPAAVMRHAQGDGPLHLKVIVDIACVEGQPLRHDAAKAQLARRRDDVFLHAVDAHAKIAQQVEAFQMGAPPDGYAQFQHVIARMNRRQYGRRCKKHTER